MTQDEVVVVMNLGAGYYSRWAHKFRDPATIAAWGRQIGPYTVDEAGQALEALIVPTGDEMPSLGALMTELRAIRRRSAPLALPVPVEPIRLRGSDFVAESGRRRDAWADERVKERVRYEGEVSGDRYSEIVAEAAEVGPFEARYLREIGVPVEVTQPTRPGGDVMRDALPGRS